MITKVKIENFKKFGSAEFELENSTILFVGPNNGGKTTALQALSLWSFLVQHWWRKKGAKKPGERPGASISRNEFYAVPVKDIRMLWTDGNVQDPNNQKININIIVSGIDDDTNKDWTYGIQLTYGTSELFYCKPISVSTGFSGERFPEEAKKIFHLPPLSGVQTSEEKRDIGAQNRTISEGRPGEILRNLLWQLHQNESKWNILVTKTTELFNCKLLKINYNESTDANIFVYYETLDDNNSKKSKLKLEISNAGSGFLQFLLLASFLYLHEGSLLLIDEPDSHMHVFLQRGMFSWLQEIASENKSKLIISTHSEVLINMNSDLDNIVAFFGSKPKRIGVNSKKLVDALKEVSTNEIVNADSQGKIFYSEGQSDLNIIEAWAATLKHSVYNKLKSINHKPINSNDVTVAIRHFKNIEAVLDRKFEGLCLLDYAEFPSKNIIQNFNIKYWNKLEIENYLIYPNALIRYFQNQNIPLLRIDIENKIKNYLENNLPPIYIKDPINTSLDIKGSVFLEKMFKALSLRLAKKDYWKIAKIMEPNEISLEVKKFLDYLNLFLGTSTNIPST